MARGGIPTGRDNDLTTCGFGGADDGTSGSVVNPRVARNWFVSDPPPRIIHLRMGNLKMANFHEFLERNWTRIKELTQTHKLVNVFIDRIEGIQ